MTLLKLVDYSEICLHKAQEALTNLHLTEQEHEKAKFDTEYYEDIIYLLLEEISRD